MTVILIMAVSLMNLVTAVMVNSALDQASEDKDVKRAYEAVMKRKQRLERHRDIQIKSYQKTYLTQDTI